MLIELGIMEYQLILPFIYPITYQIRNIMHQNTKPFYDTFISYLGYLLGGIVYLIIKYRSRKEYNDKEALFKKKIMILMKKR